MDLQGLSLVMIPAEELASIKQTQQEILSQLQALCSQQHKSTVLTRGHVTAKEFMVAVSICRSKFDQLVAGNKIKTIKKKRKIYVPATEINRYFTDPSIL